MSREDVPATGAGPAVPPARTAAPRLAMHWQILLAMLAAVLLAAVLPKDAGLFGVTVVDICKLGGGLFLNALKMLVIPLVGSSLLVAVMGLGGGSDFGRLFRRLAFWVVTTSLVAAVIGAILVNLFRPGLVTGVVHAAAGQAAPVAGAAQGGLSGLLLGIIPANPLAAAVNDHLLSVVCFALLFGIFASHLPPERGKPIRDLAQAVFDTMIAMARWILTFAPLGVFLIALDSLMTHGLGALAQLGAYVGTVLAGLTLHGVVVLPLLLWLMTRRPPMAFFRALAPAVLTAFSTASSKAAMPITLDLLESKAGVPPRTTRFVLPLATTVNMNGSALYECVAAIFVAQLYGIELGLSGQLIVVLVSLLTTLGLSGMPGAGVIGLTAVLAAAGLPAEGLALVLGVDRVLDMARTAVNVWGDACLTAIVGRDSVVIDPVSTDPS